MCKIFDFTPSYSELNKLTKKQMLFLTKYITNILEGRKETPNRFSQTTETNNIVVSSHFASLAETYQENHYFRLTNRIIFLFI